MFDRREGSVTGDPVLHILVRTHLVAQTVDKVDGDLDAECLPDDPAGLQTHPESSRLGEITMA
jgi:hypothetical protein